MKLRTYREELISEKELVATINNARNDKVKALIAFLYKTGVRIGEARAVRKKDFLINEEEGFWAVQVPTLKQRRKFFKPYRVLKIPIDGLFAKIILPYLQKIQNPETLVFPFSSTYYWKALKKANPNLYPHFFRHNLASVLSEDVDAVALQQWFGWTTLEMAVNYTHRRQAIDYVFEKQKEKYEKRKKEFLLKEGDIIKSNLQNKAENKQKNQKD